MFICSSFCHHKFISHCFPHEMLKLSFAFLVPDVWITVPPGFHIDSFSSFLSLLEELPSHPIWCSFLSPSSHTPSIFFNIALNITWLYITLFIYSLPSHPPIRHQSLNTGMPYACSLLCLQWPEECLAHGRFLIYFVSLGGLSLKWLKPNSTLYFL